MSKSLSVVLRERVLLAVTNGATHRKEAKRFGVTTASVSRWRHLQARQGLLHPGLWVVIGKLIALIKPHEDTIQYDVETL